jgi:hypothetical protein
MANPAIGGVVEEKARNGTFFLAMWSSFGISDDPPS